ncbi:MAG: cell division protein ZapE, partial [Alphaproteobacteria bacterium]|nr:cell division protein ZapE [Alphaproteobacteria bacterium]
VRGLYIHGSVGCGKTMLMDLFFESCGALPRRRLHFHEFMSGVHKFLHKQHGTPDRNLDPVVLFSDSLSREICLLCLDELHVTDIVDALMVGRLFSCLFERGVTLILTSNQAPNDLYRGGPNRFLFLPFLDLLKKHLEIFHLDTGTDYRLHPDAVVLGIYFCPPGNQSGMQGEAGKKMDHLWHLLPPALPGSAASLQINGRSLSAIAVAAGAVRFSFSALCEQALGPGDYLFLARRFHTLFLDDVPCLSLEKRNEARRFVNLIDVLYDQQVFLVMSAAGEPCKLYPEGDGVDFFSRTVSRLIEMNSLGYAKRCVRAGNWFFSLPAWKPDWTSVARCETEGPVR